MNTPEVKPQAETNPGRIQPLALGRPPAPVERPTALVLNGSPLVTLQTTPVALEDWAYGFLFSEGIIAGAEDVQSVAVAEGRVEVRARLSPAWNPEMARRRYLTSGCGKGVTFSSVRDALGLRPVATDLRVSREALGEFLGVFQAGCRIYREIGGVHGAAVVDVATGELLVREDIGRHNAVDKAIGAALRAGWNPARLVVLTTGRISYEICSKLARFGVAVGASRTAATDQAIRLARRLGMALVGYLRARHLVVYTGAERIL
ncbi:MAG: formate dehydrogenase accessory sulfurtransferase FdhD [Firmicutes bacterium]|nr:formate dehydrogenase accessory sulfurtransferase FdhD [Bacillota bacterium]